MSRVILCVCVCVFCCVRVLLIFGHFSLFEFFFVLCVSGILHYYNSKLMIFYYCYNKLILF